MVGNLGQLVPFLFCWRQRLWYSVGAEVEELCVEMEMPVAAACPGVTAA